MLVPSTTEDQKEGRFLSKPPESPISYLFFIHLTWVFFFARKLQKLLICYGFGFCFFKAAMAWKKQYGYYIETFLWTYIVDVS
jgi:hypothetical protein